MTRQIHFNAFEMNCVAHQSPGLWAYPGDRSWQYKDVEYWQDLARILEGGLFDGVFIADVIGYYDVYGGRNDDAIREGAQIPVNDPLQLAVPIALASTHLGIGITASTSFEHPYTFARRLSIADHLTKGRVGWNIVTSYLESGAKNVGEAGLRRHENRYEVANEYLEVIYKLLEGSWEDGAVLRDRERRVFADPSKVHEIAHKGRFFDVPGYHLSEPSPQRTPVLFQAGASASGIDFAARHAECVAREMAGDVAHRDPPEFGRLLRHVRRRRRGRILDELQHFRRSIDAVGPDLRPPGGGQRLRRAELGNVPGRPHRVDRALLGIFRQDAGDLGEGVLHRVRDHVAELGLNDLDPGEVLDDIHQLVVADRAGRHAVEAVEDDDPALAAKVADELEREVLAGVGDGRVAPYTATKGAVRNLTRGMATDWARHGLQVNALAPGYFETPLNQALVDDPAFTEWLAKRTPAGRWGRVDELVGAAVFLASDASSFVNGHTLYVDGGVTASL